MRARGSTAGAPTSCYRVGSSGGVGTELLKRVKRQDERLPMVMTAHGNIDAAVEAMKAGATDFLTKPLDYAMLYALLEADGE
mgnify:CR=1 FL=1